MPHDLSADDPRVRSDDDLLQRVADGAQPPTGDRVGDLMARWLHEIAEVRAPDSAPATTWLRDSRYGDPRHNPIAFLPTDSGPEGRVEYEGHHDYAWPYGRHALTPEWSVMSEHPDQPAVGVPDTADVIDLDAPDPTPAEVVNPADPDYVEPWTGDCP